jgi:adenylate cyclase
VNIDFDSEGLLKGVRGNARAARRALLEELAGDGVPLKELKRAVAEERLVLLPAERVLEGAGRRYTADEVAELSGVPRAFLDRQWQALGMAVPAEDQAVFTDADLEAAKRTAVTRQAGVPDEGIIENARVLGIAMSQVAASTQRLVGEALLRPGDTERDAAQRFANAARTMAPMMGPTLEYLFRMHLREQLRQVAVRREELEAGHLAGAREITACFADLAGFTKLGERLPAEELGTVTSRLAQLSGEVAAPPVRLVKMIGDAAMLVSHETPAVLDAALDLVEASEAEGEGFPLLRAGIARGPALARAGDWYGRPVNLASRITGIAYPGSVLVAKEVREAAGNAYRWSNVGRRHLRGIRGTVHLFRVRRAERAAAR